jgi:hypothetical protein
VCNAVWNEKSKQGTAVRHYRNVFPLERVTPSALEKEKKEEEEGGEGKKQLRVQ